jgi:hypothetical protein
MKRALIAAFVGLWLFACGGRTLDDVPSAKPHVASNACPLKTPAGWQRFLETTVDDETWVETCSDLSNCTELLGEFARHVQADVVDVLDACAPDLADNPPVAQCTAHLRRFVPTWIRQHSTGSYGFRQDNATYVANQVGPDRPAGMMTPPAALLAALPGRAAMEEAARTNGWPYVTHDSALGGVRTLVTVADPEHRFDQWMVVGLDGSDAVASPAILSFIAIQKKEANGQDLERWRLHFRDYQLEETAAGWKVGYPEAYDGKCYACHGSGMRMLIPTRSTVASSAPVRGEAGFGQPTEDDFGLRRLASLNQRLLSYGLLDWNGTLVPEDHGPALGRDLGCTSCHDGVFRGVLTVSTSEGMLRQKVVDQLSMRSPLDGKAVPDEAAMALLERERTGDPPLSPHERAELDRARSDHMAEYVALVASRFPTWKAWILDEPCE